MLQNKYNFIATFKLQYEGVQRFAVLQLNSTQHKTGK